jgi:predicted phage terminase large subunit-like protein
MNIPVIYKPLFELLNEDKNKEIDTVIITGGRLSGKSFCTSIFSVTGALLNKWRGIYLRFTNTSILDSIKSEVDEKIELLKIESHAVMNSNNITFSSGGYLSFKGIKTSSKNNTANLKSLKDFNLMVIDEAEEIPDFDTFKRAYYSIRSTDKRNLSVLILNPQLKTHWIYKTFFEDKVKDGFNGIYNNTLYIHSSYLDLPRENVADNVYNDFERLKNEDIEQYNNVVLGGWVTSLEGKVFNQPDLLYFDELPKELPICKITFVDVADRGEDFHAVPIAYIYSDGSIYIDDVLFTKLSIEHNVPMTAEIINRHKLDYARVETNYGGTAYLLLINDLITHTELLPVTATTNKHSRILLGQYNIKRKVYFRRNFKEYSEDYYLFMQNVFDYQKDGKSPHDDAPDSLEGVVSFARGLFPELY